MNKVRTLPYVQQRSWALGLQYLAMLRVKRLAKASATAQHAQPAPPRATCYARPQPHEACLTLTRIPTVAILCLITIVIRQVVGSPMQDCGRVIERKALCLDP